MGRSTPDPFVKAVLSTIRVMDVTATQKAAVVDLVKRLSVGEVQEFTDQERNAARALSGYVGIRKAAGGDLIIAWFPWSANEDENDVLAERLAVPGGLSVEDLHLTLVYLGDPANYDLDLIAAAIKIFSATHCYEPVKGRIGGLGRFIGEGNEDIIVALVDSQELEWFRDRLCDCLCEVGAWNNPGGHGYIPHITLAYVDRSQASPPPFPEPMPFEINSITVAAGPARATFDFPEYEAQAEDASPFYAARLSLVEKAGKVLSAKNFKLVKDAAQALQNLMDSASKETTKSETEIESTEDMSVDGEEVEEALQYVISKSSVEARYTFGPLYAPMRKDAHDEHTDAETLQKAVWEYVRESSANGRRINKQHEDSGQSTIGEWLEICAWPYETTIKVRVPGEDERELVMPAGTVYMGVQWDEGEAWDLVKSKKLNGYSLGGRAVRVSQSGVDLDHMGDKLASVESVDSRPLGV